MNPMNQYLSKNDIFTKGKVRPQKDGMGTSETVGTGRISAQVQNVLVMEIRQQPFQCFPFSGPFQPLYGTVHLTVFLKKDVIVVLVLFHDGEEMNVAWK